MGDFLPLATYLPVIQLTDIDFGIVMQEIIAIIPVIFPSMLGLLAVRKGISFILGMIKGA